MVRIPEQGSPGTAPCVGCGCPPPPQGLCGSPVVPKAGWEQQRGAGKEQQGSVATHLPAQEQGAKSWGPLEIWLGLTPWAPGGGGEGWAFSGCCCPSPWGAAAHTRLFQPTLLALGCLLPRVCRGHCQGTGLALSVTSADPSACRHRGSGTGTPQPRQGERGDLHRVNPHEFTLIPGLSANKAGSSPPLPAAGTCRSCCSLTGP